MQRRYRTPKTQQCENQQPNEKWATDENSRVTKGGGRAQASGEQITATPSWPYTDRTRRRCTETCGRARCPERGRAVSAESRVGHGGADGSVAHLMPSKRSSHVTCTFRHAGSPVHARTQAGPQRQVPGASGQVAPVLLATHVPLSWAGAGRRALCGGGWAGWTVLAVTGSERPTAESSGTSLNEFHKAIF